MVNLRKYVHDNTLTIPRLFLPDLRNLQHLQLINLKASGVESLPLLQDIITKITSFELVIARHLINYPGCLALCPRTIFTLENVPTGPGSARGPAAGIFIDALVEELAPLLFAIQSNVETLYLDIPPSQYNVNSFDWFGQALAKANSLSPTPISFPSLKRLLLESSFLDPDTLQHLFATSPFITHLCMFGIRKKEHDLVVSSLPMLKRL